MQSKESMQLVRNLSIIFVVALAVVLVSIFGIIPLIRGLTRSAYLDILTAPEDATITINGVDYQNAIYELEPGYYHAVIKKDGFEEKAFDLDLVGGETAKLYTFLTPLDNDWSFYELERNKVSLKNLTKIVENDASLGENQLINDLVKKINIREILPIDLSFCTEPASRMTCDSVEVTYDYEKACGNALCVIITGRNSELTNKVLGEVRNKLSEKGFDLGNYKYVYKQNTLR